MRLDSRNCLFVVGCSAAILALTGCSSDSFDRGEARALAYATPTLLALEGLPIAPDVPVQGGGPGSYSVEPDLPPGLVLDPASGIVSGTPLAATPSTVYTVTAYRQHGSATASLTIAVAKAAAYTQDVPNMGQRISPLAPPSAKFQPLNPGLADKPEWLASHAVTTAVSPDQKTLLILTSGFNLVFNPDGSTNRPDCAQYVFVYDISTPSVPVKKQVVKIPNTYSGIVFDPSGKYFYVAGGGDDCIYPMALGTNGLWAYGAPVPLNHFKAGDATRTPVGNGLNQPPDTGGTVNARIGVKPCAAGVSLSSDGLTMVVANYYNDSVTVLSGGYGQWAVVKDLDLRPGKNDPAKAGVPGGSYPFWVTVKGAGPTATAYVSSLRDREVIVVSLGASPAVTARIPVKGQPLKMILDASQAHLFVVEDQSDSVDVIDTAGNTILETIPAIAPASILPPALAGRKGANSNSVTLSPDEKQLFVTNGNLNCVAVVSLGGTFAGDQVTGLIPTGWYPTSVSFSGDGNTVYVVNAKSPTGANPGFFYNAGPIPGHAPGLGSNLYNAQQIKAGFQAFSRPGSADLANLTAQVALNNRFFSTESPAEAATMAAVRKGIKHVIYIIKENRTYDQVLGDLEVGNGDPDLALFGRALTPNQHSLARTFTTLDHFLVTSEASNDGWPWSTSAKAPDVIERQWPVYYAQRGLSLDSEGPNRSVNVAIPNYLDRVAANPLTPSDPDLLAGTTDAAAPDGPDNEVNTGYLWDAALRAHLTVRNYGFFLDPTLYNVTDPALLIPPIPDPFAAGTKVAIPASVSLAPFTDPYFRGFDNVFPDFFRYQEWARDFDAREAAGTGLPALSLVRFMHDHTGDFAAATHGVNTPEAQVADNDYAVGLLVEKISKSKYKDDTLIFVIEDDSQDGPDHVDSHRSPAFVAGAYVRQGALVSTAYNTIDFLRTIEEVLGLAPMNMNDALAHPMADLFTSTPQAWSFTAVPAPILYATTLPLPPAPATLEVPRASRTARYWARATAGMDFDSEDKIDFARYNHILWKGLAGGRPYPAAPTGRDLRRNREALLAKAERRAKAQVKR